MKAYPSDGERSVKRQTSMQDWPVFSDKAGSIDQNVGFETTTGVKSETNPPTGYVDVTRLS
jgi:hypothetical protein